ncbi:MAG TPA: hypothetical protein VF702_00520 [Allosphingosinicella sp.]|jgi:hypothetical protein
MRAPLIAALVLALAAAPAAAQPSASATAAAKPGTAQRRAILAALRPTIALELRSPVEFVVRDLRVEQGWALVIADPQRPGGGAIDGRHLPYFDDRDGLTVYALLRFGGGRWRLHDHVIGPTDVWYCGVEGPPASLLRC